MTIKSNAQAHANAMGTWGRSGDTRGRRGWEGDGRIDLRSVANSLRQLPYHVAWQRGFREAAGILNPTVPIDVALENVREMDEGEPYSLAIPAISEDGADILQADTNFIVQALGLRTWQRWPHMPCGATCLHGWRVSRFRRRMRSGKWSRRRGYR